MRMATGDTKPDLRIKYTSDDPFDPNLATDIRIIGKRGSNVVFDRAPDDIDVVSANEFVLTMEWEAGDTDTIGRIQIETEFTWPTNEIQTVRSSGGVDVYRDFDQLALTPAPPDDTETAADAYVKAVLDMQGESWEVLLNEFTSDTDFAAHTGNTSNPHAVTKAQVGLPLADNTSDIDKPVSTLQAIAINARVHKDALDVPTYFPQFSPNNWDPKFNAYNFKTTNTRLLRRGLARAATGQLSEIVVVGDSSVTGAISDVGPVFDRLRAWPMQMRDELARHGIPVGGTGLVRNNDNQFTDARWGATGTWNQTRKTYSYTSQNGATATFTTNLAGDRTTLGYYDDAAGGTFTIHVNGVLKDTITNSGPAGWKIAGPYSENIAVGQTVLFTKTSTNATTTYLRGVNVYNSTGGLVVHNIGQGGSKAFGTSVLTTDNEHWADSSDTHTLGQVFATVTSSLAQPDCVLISLGANDKAIGTSDANITTALTTVRNRWPSSDCILVACNPPAEGTVPAATYETYVASLYALADTLDVPLIDHRARLGSWSTIVANGLNGDTSAHLKVEAFADLGRNVGQLLAS